MNLPDHFDEANVRFVSVRATANRAAGEEAPPFLRTWPRVYVAVIVYLTGLLSVLTVLSSVFHYQ